MIGYDQGDDRPQRMKIIDFQFIKYASVVEDVLLFIFTSVTEDSFCSQVDHLLDVY